MISNKPDLDELPEPMANVFGALVYERSRQDQTWGGPALDMENGPEDWLGLIHRCLLAAVACADEGLLNGYIEELVKSCALHVAALEVVYRLDPVAFSDSVRALYGRPHTHGGDGTAVVPATGAPDAHHQPALH